MKHLLLGFVLVVFAPMWSCGDDDTGGPGATDMGRDAQSDAAGQPATCQTICEDIVAAECEDSPGTVQECSSECEEILETECVDEMNSLLACAGQNPTIQCGESSGDPDIVGCGAQFDALEDCLDDLEPEYSCVTLCEAVVAAECENSPESTEECPGLCGGIAQTTCSDEMDDLVSCAGDDPLVTCDQSGDPVIEDCESYNEALEQCLDSIE